jgi:hypothetical protein
MHTDKLLWEATIFWVWYVCVAFLAFVAVYFVFSAVFASALDY